MTLRETVRPAMGVSLVLTVLNEAASLPRFLGSLSVQSRLPDEVVIVDGGSSDGTVQLVEDWVPPEGVEVRLLTRAGVGIAEGRNIGIEAARCPFIAVTDGGTTLSRDWLASLVSALEEGADVASGFFIPERGRAMQSIIAAVITPDLSEVVSSRFLPSSRSIGFTKAAWSEIGGYPEWLDYCEDLVFDLALIRQGYEFSFRPDAIVTWDARPTLKAFAKQYYRYARGDGQAGLWPKRHAVRYSAHLVGGWLAYLGVQGGAKSAATVLAGGYALYAQKYMRRVWAHRSWLGGRTAPALLMVPVVLGIGDAAKMLGYPMGVVRRRKSIPQ